MHPRTSCLASLAASVVILLFAAPPASSLRGVLVDVSHTCLDGGTTKNGSNCDLITMTVASPREPNKRYAVTHAPLRLNFQGRIGSGSCSFYSTDGRVRATFASLCVQNSGLTRSRDLRGTRSLHDPLRKPRWTCVQHRRRLTITTAQSV